MTVVAASVGAKAAETLSGEAAVPALVWFCSAVTIDACGAS